MDCGTALAKQARLHPCGEALRRRIFARPRAPAPAPAPRGESERKAARKPLKRPDSRKKEIWISLPLALIFLPNDLDFPSPGFANPSTHFVKSRLSTSLPLAFIERRAAGEAPFSPKGGARRSSRVNAVGWLPALRSFDGSSSPQFNATDEYGAPRTASRIALRRYCAIIARTSRNLAARLEF